MNQPEVSPKKLRRIILEQSKRANVGHIGSALCVADILAVLYSEILNINTPSDPERDRFVLAKGHAALALYAALHLRGWMTLEQLKTFCGNGSLLGVHPEHGLEGVDFSTGSLGQGLSYAAGSALAARLQNSTRRAFVLVSDAECNEGSLWEAIMFAAHHRLSNLVVLIDKNGQQALGYTNDVLSLEPMPSRWHAFGWRTYEVDGHNPLQLRKTLENLDTREGPPHVVVCKTIFGKGVSFMENQIKWHYWPMNEQEYSRAISEVDPTP